MHAKKVSEPGRDRTVSTTQYTLQTVYITKHCTKHTADRTTHAVQCTTVQTGCWLSRSPTMPTSVKILTQYPYLHGCILNIFTLQSLQNCMHELNKILIYRRVIKSTEFILCHQLFNNDIILTRSDIIAGCALRGRR